MKNVKQIHQVIFFLTITSFVTLYVLHYIDRNTEGSRIVG